jgi:hypothetical protein
MIRRLAHRRGFVTRLEALTTLPTTVLTQPEIPDPLEELIRRHKVADLVGTYGDPSAGDPIQYDHLEIEDDDGVAAIEVFNRAILLFLSDSPELKKIHHVCCTIDDLGRARRSTSGSI